MHCPRHWIRGLRKRREEGRWLRLVCTTLLPKDIACHKPFTGVPQLFWSISNNFKLFNHPYMVVAAGRVEDSNL